MHGVLACWGGEGDRCGARCSVRFTLRPMNEGTEPSQFEVWCARPKIFGVATMSVIVSVTARSQCFNLHEATGPSINFKCAAVSRLTGSLIWRVHSTPIFEGSYYECYLNL